MTVISLFWYGSAHWQVTPSLSLISFTNSHVLYFFISFIFSLFLHSNAANILMFLILIPWYLFSVHILFRLNSDLANGQIEFNLQDGKGVYRQKGADTWIPFKARPTLLGQYSTVSTYDLSNVSGYETLTVNDFLCITNTGNTSGSKYENDSNGTIQLSIVYTAAQLSIASGILTITPALLSGSAFHNPATATAKSYLQTSVYLIN